MAQLPPLPQNFTYSAEHEWVDGAADELVGKTVKVTGTVATQVLDPLLPQITDIATRGNAGTSLPITLWIVFDPSANPQPKPNVTRMEVKLKELPITLNLTDFGKDVKITKPAT